MTFGQFWGALTGHPNKHPYPEHIEQSCEIANETIVLLKNNNNALPLKTNQIALFGTGSVNTINCGTGSGFAFAPEVISIQNGLENASIKITSQQYLKRLLETIKRKNKEDKTLSKLDRFWSGKSTRVDDIQISPNEIEESKVAEIALYVISRVAGEDEDRKCEAGDYLLSDVEKENISIITSHFTSTIVILNSCILDATSLQENEKIDAIVLMGLAGATSGNALVNVLTGKVNPSGHLTDTWALKYENYPASSTFADHNGNPLIQEYREDIYVGYRYFDSFGIKPLYPFGYGLSYTTFEHELIDMNGNWGELLFKIKITNTGSVPGKEVIQIYSTSPQGKLNKPYQQLIGFKKSTIIQPNQSEIVEIEIKTESLSSYDEENACFIMEAGDYLIRIGNHSRNTKVLGKISVDHDSIIRQVRNEVQPQQPINTLKPPQLNDVIELNQEWMTLNPDNSVKCISLKQSDLVTIDGKCKTTESDNITEKQMENVNPNPKSTLPDVKNGKVTMEEFVSSLEDEVLVRIVTGAQNETPYKTEKRMNIKAKSISAPRSTGITTSLFVDSLGIPNIYLTDGPAGLHLPGCGSTCYPSGVSVAQSWNESLANLMGQGIGKELKARNHSFILGPGMNIHRDPLCGRSFEYLSEDPLISGKIASSIVKGVQNTPGVGVSIKHFACNNQETERHFTNSIVSERALREIYLKGFEICIKESNPKTLMTCYNKINGRYASSNYNLLTNIVRGEWNFQGLIMTDWGSNSSKPDDLHAGNDLIMGGYLTDLLIAALQGKKPEFQADGYVKIFEQKFFMGAVTETFDYWNNFELDKNGSDTISTTVLPNVSINPKVNKLVEQGIATIEQQNDESKIITYRGIDHKQWLKRADLEVCACRVLNAIMNSVSYELMYNSK